MSDGVPGHECERCRAWTVLEYRWCAVCDPMGETFIEDFTRASVGQVDGAEEDAPVRGQEFGLA